MRKFEKIQNLAPKRGFFGFFTGFGVWQLMITVLSADLSKRLPLVSNDELTANAEIKARSQRTGFEVKLVHSDFCLT